MWKLSNTLLLRKWLCFWTLVWVGEPDKWNPVLNVFDHLPLHIPVWCHLILILSWEYWLMTFRWRIFFANHLLSIKYWSEPKESEQGGGRVRVLLDHLWGGDSLSIWLYLSICTWRGGDSYNLVAFVFRNQAFHVSPFSHWRKRREWWTAGSLGRQRTSDLAQEAFFNLSERWWGQ